VPRFDGPRRASISSLIAREKGVSRSSTLGNIATSRNPDETVATSRLAIYNSSYTVQVVVFGDSIRRPIYPRIDHVSYGSKLGEEMKAFGVTAVVIASMVAVLGAAPASAEVPRMSGVRVVAGDDGTSAPDDGSDLDRPITVRSYEYKVVDVVKTYNFTAKSRQLAVCKVMSGAGGGTCTMSQYTEVDARVDTEFGVSQGAVGVKIGVTAGKKVGVTVSWTSPKAPAGSVFKAFAVGTRVKYRIEKWKVVSAGGIHARSLVSTSDILTGFQPTPGFAVVGQ
jgi:hypothetical protein